MSLTKIPTHRRLIKTTQADDVELGDDDEHKVDVPLAKFLGFTLATQQMAITAAVLGYTLCSSGMLVINKLTVEYLPAPSAVLFFQFLSSAIAVQVLGVLGMISDGWIKLEVHKVKVYLCVSVTFVLSLYSNLRALQGANVETVLVVRCSTPVVVAMLDYVFNGRCLPNPRSWLSIAGMTAGAAVYVHTDADFRVTTYAWAAVYYFTFVVNQVFVKHVCDLVDMSTWARTYYSNLLCIPLAITLAGAEQDQDVLRAMVWTKQSVLALILSCLTGFLIAFSGWQLRSLVSALTFDIIGIVCKLTTILLNIGLWGKHASGVGISCLLVCIMSGAFYKQAPLRSAVEKR